MLWGLAALRLLRSPRDQEGSSRCLPVRERARRRAGTLSHSARRNVPRPSVHNWRTVGRSQRSCRGHHYYDVSPNHLRNVLILYERNEPLATLFVMTLAVWRNENSYTRRLVNSYTRRLVFDDSGKVKHAAFAVPPLTSGQDGKAFRSLMRTTWGSWLLSHLSTTSSVTVHSVACEFAVARMNARVHSWLTEPSRKVHNTPSWFHAIAAA